MRSQRSILPLNAARRSVRAAVAAPFSGPASTSSAPVRKDERGFVLKEDGSYDLSAPPPFGLSDIREAIPKQCWEKNGFKSMAYLAADVAIVTGLAAGAFALNQWWAWPLYWVAQGTMFWALFVVGHDCGHQSFSNNRHLNDLVGNITHSSILVPYHGWRISHRTHHGNHGHVENDESWHPVTKSMFDKLEKWTKLGRLSFPWSLFAYPFYLWKRSPGKEGSHYDPDCDLFQPSEKNMVLTSDAFMIGMLGLLAACTAKLGVAAMFNLYFVPYWVFVVWLDTVTYLHHHGPEDAAMKMPWYRGEEWSYLRGGLTTLDRDYGIFNKIHHNIETHVVHHLFPQIPHYNLVEATEAAKKVMGPYYREPVKSAGPLPVHLIEPLKRSLTEDQFVADEGDIVYYQKA
uniref:Fatty acid desaturase domain-containing protein n=1 Tax=Tetradesmus obliquus TaxID=3088 RepID=A0A383VUL9_TETOB|eukprot:jgi/Sobl393_1/14903/SZX68563.1